MDVETRASFEQNNLSVLYLGGKSFLLITQSDSCFPPTASGSLLLMCVSHRMGWKELLSGRLKFIQFTTPVLTCSLLLMEELIPVLGSTSCHAEHVLTES